MSQPYDVPLPFDPSDLQPVCVCTWVDYYGHEPECPKSPWRELRHGPVTPLDDDPFDWGDEVRYEDIHDYVWEEEE